MPRIDTISDYRLLPLSRASAELSLDPRTLVKLIRRFQVPIHPTTGTRYRINLAEFLKCTRRSPLSVTPMGDLLEGRVESATEGCDFS